jgi:ketosteroid isomerase-like protein
MYKTAVRWMIRRNVAALAAGDPGPLLAGYAKDAVLVFPGDSTWGGEYRGTAEIGGFLRRFVTSRLVGEVEEILVNGPPWRTSVCVLFGVRATDTTGREIYRNHAVLYARAVWGKLVFQEDFEDTHKVEAFDHYLLTAEGGPVQAP